MSKLECLTEGISRALDPEGPQGAFITGEERVALKQGEGTERQPPAAFVDMVVTYFNNDDGLHALSRQELRSLRLAFPQLTAEFVHLLRHNPRLPPAVRFFTNDAERHPFDTLHWRERWRQFSQQFEELRTKTGILVILPSTDDEDSWNHLEGAASSFLNQPHLEKRLSFLHEEVGVQKLSLRVAESLLHPSLNEVWSAVDLNAARDYLRLLRPFADTDDPLYDFVLSSRSGKAIRVQDLKPEEIQAFQTLAQEANPRDVKSLLDKPSQLVTRATTVARLRTIFPNFLRRMMKSNLDAALRVLDEVATLSEDDYQTLSRLSRRIQPLLESHLSENYPVRTIQTVLALSHDSPELLDHLLQFAQRGLHLTVYPSQLKEIEGLLPPGDGHGQILEAAQEIVAELRPKRLELHPEEQSAFFALLARGSGRFLVQLARRIQDPERFASFLPIARKWGEGAALSLEEMDPPLYGYSINSEKAINELLQILPEERQRFGHFLKTNFPYEMNNNTLSPSQWIDIWKARESLKDPSKRALHRAVVERLELTQNEALRLLDDLPKVEIPPDFSLRRVTAALETLVSIPDLDGDIVLQALPTVNDEGLALLNTLVRIGYLEDAKTAEKILSIMDSQAQRSQRLMAALASGSLEGHLKSLLENTEIEYERSDAFLQIGSWPEGVDPSVVMTALHQIPGLNKIPLFLITYFLHTPQDLETLRDPQFRVWLSRLLERVPELKVPQNSITGEGPRHELPAGNLLDLVKVYQLGERARSEVLEARFLEDWRQFTRRLHPPPAPEARTIGNYYLLLNAKNALFLLTYPLPTSWSDFDRFLAENGLRRATRESYQTFALKETRNEIRTIYEELQRNPNYGETLVYDRPPQRRADESGREYEERPSWNEAPILAKLRAILMKQALVGDPDLRREIARNLHADVADGATEFGGRIVLDPAAWKIRVENLPVIPLSDGVTAILDPIKDLGLFEYHQHALEADMSRFAGPSCGRNFLEDEADCGVAAQQEEIQIVFTSLGFRDQDGKRYVSFNVDLYGPNRLVIDLGNFESPID